MFDLTKVTSNGCLFPSNDPGANESPVKFKDINFIWKFLEPEKLNADFSNL